MDTFKRRIPVSISLPSFHQRPIEERIQLIHTFYRQESKLLGKKILLASDVIDFLVFSQFEGNIGRLKNLIKLSCANSWRKNRKNEQLPINVQCFPDRVGFEQKPKKIFFDEMEISADTTSTFKMNSLIPYSMELIASFAEDVLFFESSGFSKSIFDLLKQKTNKIFKEISLEASYSDSSQIKEMTPLMKEFTGQIDFNLKNYGISFNQKVLENFYLIYKYFQQVTIEEPEKVASASQVIRNYFSRENYLARKILEGLNQYNIVNQSLVELFFTFLINSRWESKNKLQGLIVTHGESTASSISAVANFLCKDFVFEAVNMPIDISIKEIILQVRKFIQEIDTKEGLILLVDMGSLKELYTEIKNSLEGQLLILNNVSTIMALDIGTSLSRGASFDEIVEHTQHGYHSEAQFYDGLSKGENIIVSCISGLGISEKLRDILVQYVDETKLAILTMDYERLVHSDKVELDDLLKDTRLIFSTSKVDLITDVPVLEIEKLWNPQGLEMLRKGLRDSISEDLFEELNQTFVRFFSIEGISDKLRLLNSEIVIRDVEQIILAYEEYYDVTFEMFKRLNISMHIAIMLERLIVDPQEERVNKPEFSQAEKEFNEITKDIFGPIENKYNVILSPYEIHLLFQLIKGI